MAFENWSPEENDRIVADYFAMVAQDSAQQPFNKAEHRRRLRQGLNGRSDGSVSSSTRTSAPS